MAYKTGISYPVTFKGLDTSASLGGWVVESPGSRKLPHLNSLVETTAYQILSIGRECYTVDTILVSIRALKSLDEVTLRDIPDAYALVEGTGCDVFRVWRDSNCGDTILYGQRQHSITSLDIPKSNSSIATAGSDGTSIASKVERVNILLVASKGIADSTARNVPDTDKLILSTGGKVFAIGAEAYATDVQITRDVSILVCKNADLLTSLHVVNLSRSVTSSSNVLAIVAESDTTHNTLMSKGVDKLDVQHAGNLLVEDYEPVIPCFLGVCWETVRVQVAKSVVDHRPRSSRVLRRHWSSVIRSGLAVNLRRCARAGRIRHRVVDLGSGGTDCRRSADTTFATRSRTSGA